MALLVCETFASLMGESSYTGLPGFFIRLSGCNLRCSYCDTAYAYSPGSEVYCKQPGSRGRSVRSGHCPGYRRRTSAPGGLPSLLMALVERQFTVFLETNGSRPLERSRLQGASDYGPQMPQQRHAGT